MVTTRSPGLLHTELQNRRKFLCSKVAEAGFEPARPVTGTGF